MNISLPFYPEGRGAERLASYWPDGSLKHRWRTLFATRTVVCDWCGNTRGVATSGKPCPATFRPDLLAQRLPDPNHPFRDTGE